VTASVNCVSKAVSEPWEREVPVRHRWGQHGEDCAAAELARLQRLRQAAPPLASPLSIVLKQILALEICNWRLEGSILMLCRAIGEGAPARLPIGHLASVSDERWRAVWAYYFTLRAWLRAEAPSGYQPPLSSCDPEGKTQQHVLSLLGERDRPKELYVERFCLLLEFWLGGGEPQTQAHAAAVTAVEEEIARLAPESEILQAMQGDGDGKLQPCHHKAFRRYDIILSSIGCGAWRGAMPVRGTDGLERADTLEGLLSPLCAWAGIEREGEAARDPALEERARLLLGSRDDTKAFLVALLESLLRAQQLAARQRAEARLGEASP
jgi:hypothetical protein